MQPDETPLACRIRRYNQLVPQTSSESASQTAGQVMPEFIRSAVAEIEHDLDGRLSEVELPENLRQAVRYAVLGGGKRLRPLLTVLSCNAVGGKRGEALPAAAAIELIHCFSLVHDDLPAMDDDELRRGRPTLHVHAGEAMAILAGDVMVPLAFKFIASADLDPESRIHLVAELAQATTGMINGQVYDTLGGFPSGLDKQSRLRLVHRNKTGALLRAACRMGAICGGADTQQLQSLTRYGESVGLMFQIVDDLLDVTQSPEHTGKATGKDASAGKLTFPGLLGIDGSKSEIDRLREESHQALAGLGILAQPLRDLGDLMAVRTK